MTQSREFVRLVALLFVTSGLAACAGGNAPLEESCVQFQRTVEDPASPAGMRTYRLTGATFDGCSLSDGRYACSFGTISTESGIAISAVEQSLDFRAPNLGLDPDRQWFEQNGEFFIACVEVSADEQLAFDACRPDSATGTCGASEQDAYDDVSRELMDCTVDATCRHTITFAD